MSVRTRLLLATILIAGFAVQMTQGLNPDVSWLLTVSERMLAGQSLYTDIYELNPPMSALLYLPWVWLGHSVGISPEIVVLGAIIGFVLVSVWIVSRILATAELLEHSTGWWLVMLGIMTLLPGGNFGEREHIALLALLPVLAASAARATGRTPGRWGSIAAGLGAGLAMTIKPHFALAILLPALYGAWRARSLRPIVNLETVIAGLILVGFWIGVWVWFPAFFTTMLPISSIAYLGSRAPLWAMLVGPAALPIWLILAALLVLYRRQALTPPNVQYLAAAAGFYLAYLIQGKGFTYHLLPCLALVTLSFAMAFLARNAFGRDGAARFLPVAATMVLIAAPALPAVAGDPAHREVIDLLAPLGPGLKIANITSQLEIASPLHRQLGATLVNSGPCLWITLGARRLKASSEDAQMLEEADRLEEFEREQLRDDLAANPPDIILAGADAFDWIGWASADPQIAALLENYTLMASVGPAEGPLLILKRAK